jgi:hypothetical protein
MIKDSLKNAVIEKLIYKPERHTFEVTFKRAGSTVPHVSLFTYQYFPEMEPIAFLDEKLRIGESVHFWLKSVSELTDDGWVELQKVFSSSKSPFKMGKDKKALLGMCLEGKVGISENLTPYIYVVGGKAGFRFSEAEIKMILKDPSNSLKTTSKQNVRMSGEGIEYNAKNNELSLNHGDIYLSGNSVNQLVTLFRRARLV